MGKGWGWKKYMLKFIKYRSIDKNGFVFCEIIKCESHHVTENKMQHCRQSSLRHCLCCPKNSSVLSSDQSRFYLPFLFNLIDYNCWKFVLPQNASHCEICEKTTWHSFAAVRCKVYCLSLFKLPKFTDQAGKFVSIKETINGSKSISNNQLDHLPDNRLLDGEWHCRSETKGRQIGCRSLFIMSAIVLCSSLSLVVLFLFAHSD